jgi:hypothetical protein
MPQLRNLRGDKDHLVIRDYHKLHGQLLTIDELVALRRESVAEFRQACLEEGEDLSSMSDDQVYDLMLVVQRELDEETK